MSNDAEAVRRRVRRVLVELELEGYVARRILRALADDRDTDDVAPSARNVIAERVGLPLADDILSDLHAAGFRFQHINDENAEAKSP